MNLTVLDFWKLWLPVTHAVHFAFEIQVTPPHELFGIPLEQEIVTKLEKVKKQENSLIINKQTIKVIGKDNQTNIWQRQVIKKIKTDVDFDFFIFFALFFLHFFFAFFLLNKNTCKINKH